MNYSYDIFYQSNGIDFMTFQLYNIFSTINDNKLLNLYLYENLSFIMKLFSHFEKDFTIIKSEKAKLESEMIVFFLVLLNSLLNKKENIYFIIFYINTIFLVKIIFVNNI